MAAVCTMPYAPRNDFASYHPDQPSYYTRESRNWVTAQPREGVVYGSQPVHSQPLSQRQYNRSVASAVESQTYHDSRSSQQSSLSPNARERSPRVALPSISSLLNLADDKQTPQFNAQSRRGDVSLSTPQQHYGSQPVTSHPINTTSQSFQTSRPPVDSPIPGQHPTLPALSAPLIKQEPSPEVHRYTFEASPPQLQRAFPPTPLFRPDHTESVQSPSVISNSSFSSQHYFLNTVNNPEPRVQPADHPKALAQQSHKRTHSGRIASPPLRRPSPAQSASFTRSPGATSISSQYSPRTIPHQHPPSLPTSVPQQIPHSGLTQQRPLPANFPPAPSTPVTAPSAQHLQQQQHSPGAIVKPEPSLTSDLQTSANPWEHHHYISPSSQQPYQPTQDRYICQTCNKAFSRPSSLKIHSHSHTGEKPFKCPYAGCGKAFSVRSNMKRHERGCHSGSAAAAAAAGAMLGIPSLLQ